ncbi:MAG: hypothetical protein ACI9WC_002134, partial [Arenicella sp.]
LPRRTEVLVLQLKDSLLLELKAPSVVCLGDCFA